MSRRFFGESTHLSAFSDCGWLATSCFRAALAQNSKIRHCPWAARGRADTAAARSRTAGLERSDLSRRRRQNSPQSIWLCCPGSVSKRVRHT